MDVSGTWTTPGTGRREPGGGKPGRSEPTREPSARKDTIDVWRAELGQNRARAMLLDILSRYTGRDPNELTLAQGAAGKPCLQAPNSGDVRFNMTHSESLTLVAVSAGREVGIDVETIGGRRGGRIDEVAIARRMLGDEQARRLEALAGQERRVEFLRAWTRWEARIKCLGIGIGGAAQEARRQAQGQEQEKEHASEKEALWIVDLDVGEGAIAALAVQGEDGCEVRCWEWSRGVRPPGATGLS